MADLYSPLSAGPLSVGNPSGGGGFLGALFGKEQPLPGQFGAATSEVPDLTRTADVLKGYGGTLTTQGTSALDMARRGELTPEQQAQLTQYGTGLTNQARQQFYAMGRTPDQDTAFIGATADIDAKVNAMAQQQIQSTIALGLGEISAGGNFFGQSLGFDNAAIQTLVQAGQAQLQQDQEYRKSLSDSWASIGKFFGTALGGSLGGNLFNSVASAFSGGGGNEATGGVPGGAYGGSSASPLEGLSPLDYGVGF